MSNRFVERLYDIANTKDEHGISKFDEQKLRRALDNNNSLMSRNKVTFEAKEPKFNTCKMYDPCPICDKCRNKASHLYIKCQTCLIPICVHTHADKAKMIRRDNFKARVSNETYEQFLELGR